MTHMDSPVSGTGDTVWSALERVRELHGDRTAVVDGTNRPSWAEVVTAVERAAAALVASGAAPGDSVALWAPNELGWIVAALATTSIGCVLVPMNTRFKGHEASDILARTRARVLFIHNGFLSIDFVDLLARATGTTPDVSALRRAFPSLRSIVDLGGGDAGGSTSWERFSAAGDEESLRAEVHRRGAAVSPEDVCDIIFTSGTTGRPKGALSRHRQTLGVAESWARVGRVDAEDNYLVISPFFHTFGYKAGIVVCLLAGATIVPMAVFDPSAMLDLIESERITILPGPPTVFQGLLEHPSRPGRDLSSLRLATTGATIVPVALVERMQSELSFRTVLTAYGLSEAVVVTMSDPDDDPTMIARSVGKATADFEIKVVGRDGSALAAGGSGEICVRGPNVMAGYFEDPRATAAAIDTEGWLHTGDVGHLDPDGHLTITDRLGDMFTVGGFNVYPAEVEQVLCQLTSVLEAAVVPTPDERLGSVAKAVVVPRTGKRVEPAEVIAYARERLANYKVPAVVEVVDALPRNAAGKILKRELRGALRAPGEGEPR